MDLGTVAGLPTHVLLVHIALSIVPLAAFLSVLSAVWPAARKRLGIVTPIAAIGALAVVVVTGFAGQWLLAHVRTTPLIEVHAALGPTLEPWSIALAGLCVGQWVWINYLRRRIPTRFWLAISVAIAIAVIVVATASVVKVVQIGEAGSRAIWQGSYIP